MKTTAFLACLAAALPVPGALRAEPPRAAPQMVPMAVSIPVPQLVASSARVVEGSLGPLAVAPRVLADVSGWGGGNSLVLKLHADGGIETATVVLGGAAARACTLTQGAEVTVRAIQGAWLIFSANELVATIPGDPLPVAAPDIAPR